jgi:hypothetical protein
MVHLCVSTFFACWPLKLCIEIVSRENSNRESISGPNDYQLEVNGLSISRVRKKLN